MLAHMTTVYVIMTLATWQHLDPNTNPNHIVNRNSNCKLFVYIIMFFFSTLVIIVSNFIVACAFVTC